MSTTPKTPHVTTIDNLFALTLADGIPTNTADGKTLRYRLVRLRETTVADERAALRMAERVMVGGQPKLLASDADFQFCLTLRHIDALECDGQVIPGSMVDLDLFGKLTSHDLGLVEQRVFLINLAAELRYGNISQADFDAVLAGQAPAGKGAGAPQPMGQAAELGAPAAGTEPGPALLADYAVQPAGGPGAGHGA
jgi:phage FluMu protein gp41